jgi:hypothetical protein
MIRHRACQYLDGVSTINGPTMTARTLRHDQPDSGRFSIQLLSGLFAFGTSVAMAHCELARNRKCLRSGFQADICNYELEDPMATQDQKICAHPNCTCEVSWEVEYCSAQCAAMEDLSDIDCRCSHTGCAGKAH